MIRQYLALIVSASLLLACGKPSDGNPPGKSGEQKKPPQTVRTFQTHLENQPLLIEAQGNILALDEVELRPQKTGVLKEVLVTEGTDLRHGQLLFTLDDREDRANVEKAEATLASAQATMSIAKRDLARAKELSEKNFISPSALDSAQNRLDTAEAGLAQSRAALSQAKVALSYNQIRAPFDGRAGRIDLRPGALLNSSTSAPALIKITRMDPIGVSFSLPERELPALLSAQKTGPVRVTAVLDDANSLEGQLSFIESSVDKASGTIALKAKLENAQHRAWPGQYVKLHVEAGELKNVVVLPTQAIINGPKGRFVYVVQADSSVQAQPVDLLRIFDQKAVVKGLVAGLKVVQEGTQNLRPDSRIVEAEPK